MAEEVNVGGSYAQPTPGTAGVNSQLAGTPTSVSSIAGATGGIDGTANLVQADIDQDLFKFKSDDTPLMQLMLKAKKVKVNSPEVIHFMIDEPRYSVTTASALAATSNQKTILPLASNDASIPQAYDTLLVKGVDGYAEDGATKTPGKELMLFVESKDNTSGNPVVRAVNGPKTTPQDEYCTVPAIPAGSTIILLGNALYETQKRVAPSAIVPQSTTVYLQKRGMNQIVSNYFAAQKKQIPFSQALIAEAAITEFKVRGNRTLYAGRKGKLKVQTDEVGTQDIYFTEGVRHQVRKELKHTGAWSFEEFIALAKLIFTGEDVPKSVIALLGKNQIENIQCIDYSKHPEVQIISKVNPVGWTVTSIHTVFGDIEVKHDPTLDRLGWSNSGVVLAPDRLVHYQYSAEHSSKENIIGEEATRESVLVWDALALKGSCHVWINGEGEDEKTAAVSYHFWDSAEAPENPIDGEVYYLLQDCPGIGDGAMKGELYQYKDGKWSEYVCDVMAL